ncbi:MAG: hypothetical protein Q4G03_05600 [Planctomycetia bacterium]|nr:hypothetical protein [Planctomycetia bacterium]
MFLEFLSQKEYDQNYWPFLLKFETMLSGIVAQLVKDASSADDQTLLDKLYNAVTVALNVNAGVVAPQWWDGVQLPTIAWFRDYFDHETPYIVLEIKRRAKLRQCVDDQKYIKQKALQLAHKSTILQDFIINNLNETEMPSEQ